MKIKRLGFTSFKISTSEIDIITDPILAVEAGISLKKDSAEVVILSDIKYSGEENILDSNGFTKVVSSDREKVFEVGSPGEYEVGGILIRRQFNSDFYIIDEGHIRIIYLGMVSHKVTLDEYSELGDVDVLIIPVGDSNIFPNYDKLEKIINRIDPTYLIPSGYKENGLVEDYKELKSVEEFIKHFGYTHVTNEKNFKISSGSEPENKVIEIVVLD